ncbi:MAG: glycosyl hydrolase family 28-related protein [Armatimonadota bacterium]
MRNMAAILAVSFILASSVSGKSFKLNVDDFGAKAGGVIDCTKAFQSALDKAGKTGAIVEVPQGQYRINGTLTVPPGVTLEGVWPGPHTSQLDKGSTLLAYAGRDKEDSTPFINLQTASTIKGVTIFYPEQKPKDIHPYPWTIQGRGQHYNVLDVTIVNAYNGIDCGTFHNEGHHLRNVYMNALRRGVLIDQCTDSGRVENVHIHSVYWWRVTAPYTPTPEEVNIIQDYTMKNLEGFIIGRTDWEYMSNCFVIWAKVGMHFVHTKSPVGGLANAVITQSGSDIGPLAVKVDEVQSHAGIAFENCQFMSGFEIGPDNKGPVKLSNCGFWGSAGAGSQMVLNGQGSVTLTAVHFSDWANDKPCIQANNGSLLTSNCDFIGSPNNTSHIYLGKDLISASIIGNRFRHGGPKITNESQGDVQILGNLKN